MILLKYTCFAMFAILLNLISQFLFLALYQGPADLYLAILTGTAVGLICKYTLDKKYIFYHKPVNAIRDFQVFFAYSLTGVLTTLLFWGTELLFNMLFTPEYAKYVGAIIGLSLGYICKYLMDKKFVFVGDAL